jgi:hypothetical protein
MRVAVYLGALRCAYARANRQRPITIQMTFEYFRSVCCGKYASNAMATWRMSRRPAGERVIWVGVISTNPSACSSALLHLSMEVVRELDRIRAFERRQVDDAVTHDFLDDRTTQQIVSVQRMSTRDRHLPACERITIGRQVLLILYVQIADLADGTHA